MRMWWWRSPRWMMLSVMRRRCGGTRRVARLRGAGLGAGRARAGEPPSTIRSSAGRARCALAAGASTRGTSRRRDAAGSNPSRARVPPVMRSRPAQLITSKYLIILKGVIFIITLTIYNTLFSVMGRIFLQFLMSVIICHCIYFSNSSMTLDVFTDSHLKAAEKYKTACI